MISEKLKKAIEQVRNAIYGQQVREAIASSMEAVGEAEYQHEIDTTNKINIQNVKIEELGEKFIQAIQSGTANANILEIINARGEYETLGQRLDAELLVDVLLGNERNRLLKAYDSLGELLGKIDNEGFYFSTMGAGDIDCPVIPKMIPGGDLYIDCNEPEVAILSESGAENEPFKTIEHCFEYLKGKVIDENLIIHIRAGEYNEHITISNILGSGNITIVFEKGVKINGGLYIKGIQKAIAITGNNAIVSHGGETTKANGAIYVDNCDFVNINGLQVIGINGTSDWGIIAYKGSNVFVDSCNITGFNHWGSATSAQYNSKLVIKNCKGSTNNKSIHALYGSSIVCEGTIPNATTKGNCDVLSTLTDNNAVMTNADSGETAPVPPASSENPTTTHILSTNKITSYCGKYGWDLTTGSYQHKLYQGKYYSSYGESWNWRGYFSHDRQSFLNIVNGKEVVGIKMRFSRKSVGGDSATIKVRLFGTVSRGTGSAPTGDFDYGYITAIKKGETIWVDLPREAINHMINYNIAGFILYHPQGTGEVVNYGIFEDTTGQLQITVR